VCDLFISLTDGAPPCCCRGTREAAIYPSIYLHKRFIYKGDTRTRAQGTDLRAALFTHTQIQVCIHIYVNIYVHIYENLCFFFTDGAPPCCRRGSRGRCACAGASNKEDNAKPPKIRLYLFLSQERRFQPWARVCSLFHERRFQGVVLFVWSCVVVFVSFHVCCCSCVVFVCVTCLSTFFFLQTALHLAAAGGHVDAVRVLAPAGLDCHELLQEDKYLMTPWYLACESG